MRESDPALGRHGFRNSLGENRWGGLPSREVTIPEMLGTAYRSAAIGKWHLGDQSTPARHVTDAGFEYYAGNLGAGIGDYFSWDKTIVDGETVTWIYDHDVYATTDVVDEAIGRIQAFGSDPWFLWVAFNAVHSPIHIPPLDLLEDPTVYDWNSSSDKARAMLEALDTEIGRLLLNVPANTTVIFVGDNGSQKGRLTENGLRVPMIVRRPGLPFPGAESQALVSVTDVFDTVAEIANVTADAEDSESLLTYLGDSSQPTIVRTAPGGPYIYSESFRYSTDGTRAQRAIRGELHRSL